MGRPALSLITPMYNESASIAGNVRRIVAALENLELPWEYILVDDGSTDGSAERAKEVLGDDDRCKLIRYSVNRGRGYALRTGFAAARGDYVIATEADLSWGEPIIETLHRALQESGADVVIASVHLPGGRLENVPLFRRVLTRWGNIFMRWCYGGQLTMLSGMTRGYRRQALAQLYLEEDRKEVHLEIVEKAQALGLKIVEVPGTIRWEPPKEGTRGRSGRGIIRFIVPHLMSSFSVASVRVMLWLSGLLLLCGAGLVGFGLANKLLLITPQPMPNLVTYGLVSMLSAGVVLLFTSVSLQLSLLKRSLVHLQAQLKQLTPPTWQGSDEAE